MGRIDFGTRDTEAGWQQRLDKFWLAAIPKWFEWMGWLLVLAALSFVSERTENLAVKIITAVSYLSLFMYFQSFFFQFEFVNVPVIKKYPSLTRLFSLILSASLGVAIYFLIEHSIRDFAIMTMK